MACKICDMIAGKVPCARIYEDDKVIAFLAERPATIGHIVVAPKNHHPIFEALDDGLVEHVSAVANKISIAVFEAIKCEGTNMIVNNGLEAGQEDPHFSVNVIARKGGDGLNFEWQPKQVSEDELGTLELQLKEELSKGPSPVGSDPTPPDTPKPQPAAEELSESEKGEDAPANKEENYMIKQLRRMP